MKRLCVCMILAVAAISFVFAGAAAAKEINLTAASGGMGGSWFGQMAALSKVIQDVEPEIILKTVPGSGLANAVRVNTNEAQIAWSMPLVVKWAYEGKEDFKTPNPNIRGIANGFTLHPVQMFITRDLKIANINEIREKKIPLKLAVATKGRVDETVARMLLEYYGMSYKMIESWGGRIMFLEYGDQTKRIQDRQANATIQLMPNPIGLIQEIVLTTPLKDLPHDRNMPKAWEEKYGTSTQKIVPTMYEQKVIDEEFTAPAVDLALITNKDADEAMVYKITKAICENETKIKQIGAQFQEFKKEIAWKNMGCPLHPGAEKYYREKGYMK